jgi:ubiquinone/menaquinone biosynthesis C-methylase UbiE
MIDSGTPITYDRFRNPKSPFHRDKYREIFETIEKNPDWKVLEIGCGTGVYTELLRRDFDDVYTFDISPEMIKLSKRKSRIKNVNFMVADSLRIPVRSGSVDLVVGVSILHHIENRTGVLAEVKRVLKPDGYFVFCEPNKLNVFTSIFQLLQREDAISRFEMKKMIEGNGLEVVALREILFRNPKTSDVMKRWLNSYSRFEKILERLHAGVTLLAIGRK